MSFENKNLYHLLGNDVEEDSVQSLPIREVVKKNSSSKKADVPPTSADPSKAKKKTKVAGNEGAIKNKPNNKSLPGPSSTPSKHYKKPLDRHSRSHKSDFGKKYKQGAASHALENEDNAVADAVADATESENDGAAEADVAPKQSLSDYFADLQVKQLELDSRRTIRKANAGNEDKWTAAEKLEKEEESYIAPSTVRKNKAKAPKEKKFLDINASFADETSSSNPSNAPRRFGDRGGKRGGFSSKKPTNTRSAPKPAVNDKYFPSL